MISAEEAFRMGLVNRIVPAERLVAEARAVVRAILDQGPLAVAACLRLVDEQETSDMEQALARESEVFAELVETADFREGTAAFLEKRAPRFEGR
jgi:enoyl-CoA hydratase